MILQLFYALLNSGEQHHKNSNLSVKDVYKNGNQNSYHENIILCLLIQ